MGRHFNLTGTPAVTGTSAIPINLSYIICIVMLITKIDTASTITDYPVPEHADKSYTFQNLNWVTPFELAYIMSTNFVTNVPIQEAKILESKEHLTHIERLYDKTIVSRRTREDMARLVSPTVYHTYLNFTIGDLASYKKVIKYFDNWDSCVLQTKEHNHYTNYNIRVVVKCEFHHREIFDLINFIEGEIQATGAVFTLDKNSGNIEGFQRPLGCLNVLQSTNTGRCFTPEIINQKKVQDFSAKYDAEIMPHVWKCLADLGFEKDYESAGRVYLKGKHNGFYFFKDNPLNIYNRVPYKKFSI